MFQLKNTSPLDLTRYLRRRKWLSGNEEVKSVSVPGAGNMNYVIRVDTGARTFILKQANGYVEKYPQVPAPANRAVVEGRFYQLVSSQPVMKNHMPAFLGMDKTNHVLALEDLGEASDYSFLYALNQKLQETEIQQLLHYLNLLHTHFQQSAGEAKVVNLSMRRLNHEHIFHYPFMVENGFNLDAVQPGLQEVAMRYKQDTTLKKEISALGKVYLSSGDTLLHGDYYPGSWLNTRQGIRVIDPEFCFHGCREFDLAVMMAHLTLTRHPDAAVQSVLKHYAMAERLNIGLLNRFIGVEIMRRLIGLAQLPLACDLSTKKELLEKARQLILT
ncbi:MAG: phosphotransferase [Saprospiraceae bacterium]|nr:phosphotransferase [Saprospiraceae bacterium]